MKNKQLEDIVFNIGYSLRLMGICRSVKMDDKISFDFNDNCAPLFHLRVKKNKIVFICEAMVCHSMSYNEPPEYWYETFSINFKYINGKFYYKTYDGYSFLTYEQLFDTCISEDNAFRFFEDNIKFFDGLRQ